MSDMTRRTIISAAAATAAGSAVAAERPAVAYEIKPLPFDAAGIAGLSEKLLRSHHEKNYAGAVKRLGAIETRLAAIDVAAEPGFALNGLKREELIALNSMTLHEVYFASFLGAVSPDKKLAAQIARDFGSEDRWRAEFAAMGRALGGGSGWVLLTFSPRAGRLINIWAAEHTMTAADGAILVALDMYEHAYAMDYGADASAYVDAYMKALRWDHAGIAFKRAA
jgi:Fe-Mn family superoxide dismutase